MFLLRKRPLGPSGAQAKLELLTKLQAMREAGKPVSAGAVTKALGADRKEVDKAFAELKKEGAIVSPIRCKWAPAQ